MILAATSVLLFFGTVLPVYATISHFIIRIHFILFVVFVLVFATVMLVLAFSCIYFAVLAATQLLFSSALLLLVSVLF